MSGVMLYRPQRGGLEESVAEIKLFTTSTYRVLAKEIGVAPERLSSIHLGLDGRTGWDTWLITVDGNAVGYTDKEPC